MSHVFVSFLLTTFQLQKCFLFEKLFDNFFLKIEFSLEVRFFSVVLQFLVSRRDDIDHELPFLFSDTIPTIENGF